MLDQLRNKIQNVQIDLYSRFKILGKKSEDLSNIKNLINDEINLDAGFEILSYYQDKWDDLHKLMVNNVDFIDSYKSNLQNLKSVLDNQSKIKKEFNLIANNLNDIVKSMDLINQDLENIQVNLKRCEDIITFHKKQKLNQKLANVDFEEEINFKLETNSRYLEYENFKLKLKKNHEKVAENIEKNASVFLKKKQEIYQSVFEKDFQEYKKNGKLNYELKSKLIEKKSSLENVDVEVNENDLKLLDEFLESD